MVNWKSSQQKLTDSCGFSRIKWHLNLKWNVREPFQSMNFFVKPSFQYELMGSCSFSRIKLLIVQFCCQRRLCKTRSLKYTKTAYSRKHIYVYFFFFWFKRNKVSGKNVLSADEKKGLVLQRYELELQKFSGSKIYRHARLGVLRPGIANKSPSYRDNFLAAFDGKHEQRQKNLKKL